MQRYERERSLPSQLSYLSGAVLTREKLVKASRAIRRSANRSERKGGTGWQRAHVHDSPTQPAGSHATLHPHQQASPTTPLPHNAPLSHAPGRSLPSPYRVAAPLRLCAGRRKGSRARPAGAPCTPPGLHAVAAGASACCAARPAPWLPPPAPPPLPPAPLLPPPAASPPCCCCRCTSRTCLSSQTGAENSRSHTSHSLHGRGERQGSNLMRCTQQSDVMNAAMRRFQGCVGRRRVPSPCTCATQAAMDARLSNFFQQPPGVRRRTGPRTPRA